MSVAVAGAAGRSTPVIPHRLSPTALERYRACPKSFHYQYVLKEEGEDRPSGVLVAGNAVHHTLELCFGLPPEERNVEVLHQALRSVWPKHRNPEAFLSIDEEINCGRGALDMLTRFAESDDLSVIPRAREEWVSTKVADGIQVFGKVDRIDPTPSGGLIVIDYKTGKRTLAQRDLPANLAAQVYSLAVQDRFRKPVEEFRLVYLALSKTLSWRPSSEELEGARQRLTQLTEEILADSEFKATPSSEACRFCSYAHICPDKGRVELSDLVVSDEVPF